ncbi:MAG: FIST N-terminal domain-containing protein, partial [Nitrospiraceae bacterium]
MLTGKDTRLRFAVAVSRDSRAALAGRAIARAARSGLGPGAADLACLFFSSHYAERAEELSAAVHEELGPRLLLGCTGEGVIAGTEEIEGTAAVTLWAARLPGAHLTPVR